MSHRTRRLTGAAIAGVCSLAMIAAPAFAGNDKASDTGKANASAKAAGPLLDVQLLSFNDFHGHLKADDPPLNKVSDPSQTPAGGVEYLAAHLDALRAKQPAGRSLTVAAGDLIGGSTFLSGIFQDQPTIEAMNVLGLDVSSVGNHEFDEGTVELRRMIDGGCHPTIGCFTDLDGNTIPYAGADFPYLGANVVNRSDGKPFLPPYTIKNVNGEKIGFIGMTLEATSTLVSPGGIKSVQFLDEVKTANRYAKELTAKGVNAIVVLVHEGLNQSGTYTECVGASGPMVDIAKGLDPAIDFVVTGHTHQPYICNIPDPAGNPRVVTSAASYGQVITESHLAIDRRTGDVVRDRVSATNHLVTRDVDRHAGETRLLNFWGPLADVRGAEVVGSFNEDILGGSSTCRCQENDITNLVADAMLWGTQAADRGGAQIAFMNTGGVRSQLDYDALGGKITYQQAYNIAPFNNLLVTIDLTGAQIEQVLNEQLQWVDARGSRPMLSLGVSEGFSYEWVWEGTAPGPNQQPPKGTTGHVKPGSMMLNGVPIDPAQTYRVATLSFLQEGGDLFTTFTEGTNLLGGQEDLKNLVDYFEANPGLDAPADRVAGL